MSRALMLLGTASGVGKSLLTAGLCRLLRRAGVRVAPFKPQNMSNNAAACADGGEIGRAQALQALACGLHPHSDMNPVLIKPEGAGRAQLVVSGRPRGTLRAGRFRSDRAQLLPEVLAAFERLCAVHEFVLVEGAGSAAEPNLREGDIANLGFAQAADLDAWLVGDIDRGGVFASLLGTLAALDEKDRARVEGLVVNRFRGDLALLGDALQWTEARTARPVLGVVPMLEGLCLPEEDAPVVAARASPAARHRVAVVQTPTASNLTDLDALALVPQLEVALCRDARELEGADLVVLPGAKAVRRDLAWLRELGFEAPLARHLRYGGRVLGICGGLQMLGTAIHDPDGVEGGGTSRALGLLPIETELRAEKRVERVRGLAEWPRTVAVEGYEIHHGRTTASRARWPFQAISEDGRVFGTYLHGLFDLAPFRDALLQAWLGLAASGSEDLTTRQLRDLDRVADVLAERLDLRPLEARLGRALAPPGRGPG